MDKNSNLEKLTREQRKNISRVCWSCSKIRPNLQVCNECKIATYCDEKCKKKDMPHLEVCKSIAGGINKERLNLLFVKFITSPASKAILKALKLYAIEGKFCVLLQVRPVVSGEGTVIQYRIGVQPAPSVEGFNMRVDFCYNNNTITKIINISKEWSPEDLKEMEQIKKDAEYLLKEGVFVWKDEYIVNPEDKGISYERNRRVHLNEIKPIEFIIGSITRANGSSHFESVRVEHVQSRNT